MDWTSIILAIIGTGILTTIANALINKRERALKNDGLGLTNLKDLIDFLGKKIETLERRQESDRKEYHDYVVELRNEISNLRAQREEDKEAMLQAYRCKYPEDLFVDCPVLRAKRAKTCTNCNDTNEG